MTSYIDGEFSIFLWAIAAGAIIMVIYDIFSIPLSQKDFPLVVCNICDGIFVTCATAIMIFILMCVSNGYIRGYEFVGALIGGFLYKLTLSNLIKGIFSKIFLIIYRVFELFFKILLTPIKFMYKIMYNSMRVVYGALRRWFAPLTDKCSRVLSSVRTTSEKHRRLLWKTLKRKQKT